MIRRLPYKENQKGLIPLPGTITCLWSRWKRRLPAKEEIGGSSPSRHTMMRSGSPRPLMRRTLHTSLAFEGVTKPNRYAVEIPD